MIAFVMGLLGGTVALQWLASLPSWPWLVMLCAGAGAALLAWVLPARLIRHSGWLLAGVLVGFGNAGWRAELALSERLSAAFEGSDLRVSGRIVGLPHATAHGQRFGFEIDAPPPGVPHRVLLHAYRPQQTTPTDIGFTAPEFRAGQVWEITVRLRRPHGNANPLGFDVEAWMLTQGWRATGYLRPAPMRLLSDDGGGLMAVVDRTRQGIRERFLATLRSTQDATLAPYAGVLVALAVGDQAAVPSAQWQRFARSGITHLVSISGLHVTMLAALVHILIVRLWRAVVLASPRAAQHLQRLPAHQLGAAGAGLAALGYAVLAGFGVPAQRTAYMVLVAVLAVLTRRHASPWRVLALALLTVILFDPWCVLAVGFWLSFGAVAVLFFAVQRQVEGESIKQAQCESAAGDPGSGATWRQRLRASVRHWVHAQGAITLVGIPALIALFQQFSLISPLANAVAIPLVSWLVTPLCLLAMVPGLEFLLTPAHALFALMMHALDALTALPWAVWQQAAPPAALVALSLGGCALCLWPRLGTARWLGLLTLAPLLSWQPPRPAEGEVWLRVLDVGQGQAVHVQTAGHDLLFDTGPGQGAESDAGSRIVVPYLRALGVQRLNRLVLSHSDRDHAGGTRSVLDAVMVDAASHSLAPDDELRVALGQLPESVECSAGQRWAWDGVEFEFVHPLPDIARRGDNPSSCVLRVVAGGHAALIPGDIDVRQESALAGRRGDALRSEILVVPHHGSITSSSPALLAAVQPAWALIPVGYRSRFGHPHPEVLSRYVAQGAAIYRSDLDGALTVRFGASGISVDTWRSRERRYWHEP